MSIDRSLAHGLIQQTTTSGDNRAVLVNVSQLIDAGGGSNEQPVFGTAGFYLWPMPPDDDGACEVVTLREADGDTVIASRDLRLSKRATPEEGDVGITHYGGGYLTMRWDDETRGTLVVLSAPRLDSDLDEIEEAHGLIMDPSDAQNGIMLLHRRGTALIMNKDGDAILSNADGTASLVIYDDGSAAVRCDQGLKVSGAMVIGDVTLAREVALVQEVADAFTTVATALAALSIQVQAPPQNGTGIAAQVAELAVRIAAINGTGTAKTLKASPL